MGKERSGVPFFKQAYRSIMGSHCETTGQVMDVKVGLHDGLGHVQCGGCQAESCFRNQQREESLRQTTFEKLSTERLLSERVSDLIDGKRYPHTSGSLAVDANVWKSIDEILKEEALVEESKKSA